MPRAAPPPATADDGSSTAAAPEPSMTSVSMTKVTDPSSVNTESAGVEDAESSQGGKPAQPEPGKDLTAEEEALLPRRTVPAVSDRDAARRRRHGPRGPNALGLSHRARLALRYAAGHFCERHSERAPTHPPSLLRAVGLRLPRPKWQLHARPLHRARLTFSSSLIIEHGDRYPSSFCTMLYITSR